MVETVTRDQQVALLETFDNPRPERDYRIVHTCPEFTSVCPKRVSRTLPPYTIDYIADKKCLELKALKLYFFSYRQVGAFYEDVTNRILDDLVAACEPRQMTVRGDFNVRGGFSSTITAEYRKEA
jgi:7-cyano-7-deazaguanine reductase